MLKKSRYERKRDIYGNIVQVVRQLKDGIEETKYEYDLKGRLVNTSTYYSVAKEFVLEHYYYEDDEHGNTIKKTLVMEDQEIDELGDKIVVREHKNEWSYKNSYSSKGTLESISVYDREGCFCYTQSLYIKTMYCIWMR